MIGPISQALVEIAVWTPTLITCRIDQKIYGEIKIADANNIRVTSNLRRWVGVFTYERFHGGVANMQTADPLKETTKFTIAYRGFGTPCPANVTPLPIKGSVADTSMAEYTLKGSATVVVPSNFDPCMPTTSVTLVPKTGIQSVNCLSQSNLLSYLKAYTKDIQGGIELKIGFVVQNAMTGVIVKRTNCSSTSFDPPRSLNVQFEGFTNKTFNLAFAGTSGLKLEDPNPVMSNPLSSGILIEAWDGTGNPSHYQTDGLVPAKFYSN